MAGEPKDSQSRFYFTPEQLANSPSRKCGMDADQELQYRQRAANLIQDMGQRLHVSQLCINTAIVYMHRFYAFHSFTHFHRNSIAAAALFLAAKVEEQPRKLEHVIKVSHLCLNQEPPDPSKEPYQEQAQDLVFNENVLLQTLGFDVAIDHPHTHVVKTCSLVKASKELAQTSYFMASNSLHLTTMCLQYRPTVVACFCIHLACKWSRWEIPQSTEGKHWFQYVDKTVTLELLKQLTDEFLHIFDRCPTRLKRLKTLSSSTQQVADEQRKAKEEAEAAAAAAAAASSGSMSSGSTSSTSHHKAHHGHHSSSHGHHNSSQSSQSSSKVPPLDHQKTSSRMSLSSSSQMQRPKSERPSGSHSSSSSSGSTYNQSGAPPSAHMRPPSGSSRDSQQQYSNKVRPHSMGAPSNTQHQSMKDRHMSSSGNNGNINQSHMKHDSKTTKIHPASIGVQNQMDPMRKSYPTSVSKQPPQNYNQIQKHRNVGPPPPIPHSGMQKQQSSQSKPPPPQMPPTQFKLLDDSVITDTSLKSSPTHSQTSKPTSIFSPDWKDTSSSSVIPPLATMSSQPPQPPQQSQIRSSQSSRNSSSHSHSFKQQPEKKTMSQPPPLVGILGGELDFLKQEKISNEPPQQLLATKDIGREQMKPHPSALLDPKSIKRPAHSHEDDMMREIKMRRLEARMDGSEGLMPDLTNVKQEEKSSLQTDLIKREPDKWQQIQQQPPTKTRPDELHRQSVDQISIKQESDKWKRARDFYPTAAPTMDIRSVYNDTQSSMQYQSQQYQQQQQTNMHMSQQQIPTHQMNTNLSNMMPPSSVSSVTGGDTKPMKPILSTVNGIETNPDLISSLLKESLCSTDSKFGPSLAPPHTTLLPISETPGPLLSDTTSNFTDILSNEKSITPPSSNIDNVDSSHHRKSEKKKKKEKHKHKDRSKDKEERKKHKKDKDRHRDRSREREHYSSGAGSINHQTEVKVTIPKTKINLPLNQEPVEPEPQPTGLKLKIAKDRIKSSAPVASSGSALKIKISLKDTSNK